MHDKSFQEHAKSAKPIAATLLSQCLAEYWLIISDNTCTSSHAIGIFVHLVLHCCSLDTMKQNLKESNMSCTPAINPVSHTYGFLLNKLLCFHFEGCGVVGVLLLQRYFGCALGKGSRTAATEIEKGKFGDLTCREALTAIAKM